MPARIIEPTPMDVPKVLVVSKESLPFPDCIIADGCPVATSRVTK